MYYISFTHACTLIALSYVALKLKNRLFMERHTLLIASLLTGIACIIMMLKPFPNDSLLTDLRFAPIIMAGLRFGSAVSLLSAILPSLYIFHIGEPLGIVRIMQDLVLPAVVSSLYYKKEHDNGYAMIPFQDGIKICVILAAIRLGIHVYLRYEMTAGLILSHMIMLVISILAIMVLIVMYNDDNRSMILQRRFELLANQDGLTGLPNLRSFMTIARNTFQQRPLSIMMIDIDNFKRYNDTFGHLQGDKLLRDIGQLLRSLIDERDYAARYGGEEFIIMSHTVDISQLEQYAQRLCSAVEEHLYQGTCSSPTTISIGISISGSNKDDLLRMISEADEALYISKNTGKNRYTFFTSETGLAVNNA
ncbi:diguanylate cyclase [Paenibacillus sp. UNC451MF]|uniref:diguanylate cyclase n=1 Tax=Paenibacillus sp. UNC451MF TaxID=1449063 RepID=UPI00068FB714|nr:diguanylate cyclase [Paenibacillus sp. UNC451MF]